jgi:hypothetical protein
MKKEKLKNISQAGFVFNIHRDKGLRLEVKAKNDTSPEVYPTGDVYQLFNPVLQQH